MMYSSGCWFCRKEKDGSFWIVLETESYLQVKMVINGKEMQRTGGDPEFCSINHLCHWFSDIHQGLLNESAGGS